MGIPYSTNLPPDLQALKEPIESHARSYDLEFYETIFEVLEGEDLNEVAAYGGFPHALPALVLRHVLRGAEEGLRLRFVEDLRDGHQQ